MFMLIWILALLSSVYAGTHAGHPLRLVLSGLLTLVLYALGCYFWQRYHGMPGLSDPDFLRHAMLAAALCVGIFLMFAYERACAIDRAAKADTP